MTDQPALPIPPESFDASAAALGYELRERPGGGWTIYVAGTDFIVTWMLTEYALARFLSLGGARESAE